MQTPNVTLNATTLNAPDTATKLTTYYRLHAKIYDLTRWSFLFGRRWLIDWLPFERPERLVFMEVGCGTGTNLKYAAEAYPRAKLIGWDLSSDMLDVASRKLTALENTYALRHRAYGTESGLYANDRADVILFSYCLTMVNPDWEKLLIQAKNDLKPGGVLAVVDFHDSKVGWFKRWMGVNHVRMDGHILPFLQQHFKTVKVERRRAYWGLWSYFLYLGEV